MFGVIYNLETTAGPVAPGTETAGQEFVPWSTEG
jgi:hypothetical protein